jgi:molybdopterin-guanine dinucleotide biosynthesis protein A
MKTSHTHKSVVYWHFNGKVEPMLTVFHRSFREALDCLATKQYIDRHNVQSGMYANVYSRTVEGA